MKRSLAVLFSLGLVTSLVGCSNSNEQGNIPKEPTQNSNTNNSETNETSDAPSISPASKKATCENNEKNDHPVLAEENQFLRVDPEWEREEGNYYVYSTPVGISVIPDLFCQSVGEIVEFEIAVYNFPDGGGDITSYLCLESSYEELLKSPYPQCNRWNEVLEDPSFLLIGFESTTADFGITAKLRKRYEYDGKGYCFAVTQMDYFPKYLVSCVSPSSQNNVINEEKDLESPKPTPTPVETFSQAQAKEMVFSYLSVSSFSRTGLIDQLIYEGFSRADAEYGVDASNTNWALQASLKAQDYLDVSSFSKQGLIEQLMYEGFTRRQAEYGVRQVGFR